jgi:hypothetical protein
MSLISHLTNVDLFNQLENNDQLSDDDRDLIENELLARRDDHLTAEQCRKADAELRAIRTEQAREIARKINQRERAGK